MKNEGRTLAIQFVINDDLIFKLSSFLSSLGVMERSVTPVCYINVINAVNANDLEPITRRVFSSFVKFTVTIRMDNICIMTRAQAGGAESIPLQKFMPTPKIVILNFPNVTLVTSGHNRQRIAQECQHFTQDRPCYRHCCSFQSESGPEQFTFIQKLQRAFKKEIDSRQISILTIPPRSFDDLPSYGMHQISNDKDFIENTAVFGDNGLGVLRHGRTKLNRLGEPEAFLDSEGPGYHESDRPRRSWNPSLMRPGSRRQNDGSRPPRAADLSMVGNGDQDTAVDLSDEDDSIVELSETEETISRSEIRELLNENINDIRNEMRETEVNLMSTMSSEIRNIMDAYLGVPSDNSNDQTGHEASRPGITRNDAITSTVSTGTTSAPLTSGPGSTTASSGVPPAPVTSGSGPTPGSGTAPPRPTTTGTGPGSGAGSVTTQTTTTASSAPSSGASRTVLGDMRNMSNILSVIDNRNSQRNQDLQPQNIGILGGNIPRGLLAYRARAANTVTTSVVTSRMSLSQASQATLMTGPVPRGPPVVPMPRGRENIDPRGPDPSWQRPPPGWGPSILPSLSRSSWTTSTPAPPTRNVTFSERGNIFGEGSFPIQQSDGNDTLDEEYIRVTNPDGRYSADEVDSESITGSVTESGSLTSNAEETATYKELFVSTELEFFIGGISSEPDLSFHWSSAAELHIYATDGYISILYRDAEENGQRRPRQGPSLFGDEVPNRDAVVRDAFSDVMLDIRAISREQLDTEVANNRMIYRLVLNDVHYPTAHDQIEVRYFRDAFLVTAHLDNNFIKRLIALKRHSTNHRLIAEELPAAMNDQISEFFRNEEEPQRVIDFTVMLAKITRIISLIHFNESWMAAGDTIFSRGRMSRRVEIRALTPQDESGDSIMRHHADLSPGGSFQDDNDLDAPNLQLGNQALPPGGDRARYDPTNTPGGQIASRGAGSMMTRGMNVLSSIIATPFIAGRQGARYLGSTFIRRDYQGDAEVETPRGAAGPGVPVEESGSAVIRDQEPIPVITRSETANAGPGSTLAQTGSGNQEEVAPRPTT